MLIVVGGCAAPNSQFVIVDHRVAEEARGFQETFDEAWFDVDARGNVDIVLRRESVGPTGEDGPPAPLIQLVHIRGIWRAVPGRTVADRTQINGKVTYGIIGGSMGATFEGAGALFYRTNRRGNQLRGSLDLARLQPTRKLGHKPHVFERAELSGTFRARRDPRRVVRMINELNRLFGPLPPPAPAGGS